MILKNLSKYFISYYQMLFALLKMEQSLLSCKKSKYVITPSLGSQLLIQG